MKSKLAFLILAVSVIFVTQICYAGQTKHAPSVQAREATVVGRVIEREKAEGSVLSGKLRRVTLVGGTNASGP